MEPLDTDLEYRGSVRGRRSINATRRFSWLYLFPILGVLVVLFFASAGLFQLNLSSIIDGFMGLLLVVFALMVIIFFWAASGRAKESQDS